MQKNENKNNEELNVVSQNIMKSGENAFVIKEIVVNNGEDVGNDGRKDFDDLNGVHFPKINELNKDKSLNNVEVRECLDEGCNSENSAKSVDCAEKQDNKDKSAGKQSENGSIAWGCAIGGIKLADMIKGNKLDNKLMQIPTEMSEVGEGIVVFDDEIIELGSQKWKLIVCGQGCNTGFNEARYHIRRMWYKFGLKEVTAENGVFYFKFQDEVGINEVINNGPWMVNNKPLVVQKWCVDMCLDKMEPKKIPVWVKLVNVPMEAWSVKGISALASSIGKPVIMDEVATKMCVIGIGRFGFARVLVEIDAEKGLCWFQLNGSFVLFR
ncbi:zinc knuckle CX2CX4HX4C containing protein [Tanacetum coccineum]